jgi:hypothetical protein
MARLRRLRAEQLGNTYCSSKEILASDLAAAVGTVSVATVLEMRPDERAALLLQLGWIRRTPALAA